MVCVSKFRGPKPWWSGESTSQSMPSPYSIYSSMAMQTLVPNQGCFLYKKGTILTSVLDDYFAYATLTFCNFFKNRYFCPAFPPRISEAQHYSQPLTVSQRNKQKTYGRHFFFSRDTGTPTHLKKLTTFFLSKGADWRAVLGSFFRKLGAKLGQIITKSIEGVGSNLCMAVGSPRWVGGIALVILGGWKVPGRWFCVFLLEVWWFLWGWLVGKICQESPKRNIFCWK